MKLPNIGSSDWEWEDDNGLYPKGISDRWEISIRCGWIEIAFLTEDNLGFAALDLPAPKDDEKAKRIAEECAIFLQDKLHALAFDNPHIAKHIPR